MMRQVHLLYLDAAVYDSPPGDDLQALQQAFRFHSAVGFHQSDHDVDSVFLEALGFQEHLIRLAYSGGVPQVNLESATLRPANEPQKAVGTIFHLLLSLRSCCFCQWFSLRQSKPEGRSPAGLGRQADTAAVGLDDFPDDRQTQSDPCGRFLAGHAVKGSKTRFTCSGGMPMPVSVTVKQTGRGLIQR
jgi:hypothetical protein